MKTSTQDNQSFTNNIMERNPLDKAIDWIADNMVPEDVFSQKQLEEWALESGFQRL